MPKKTTLDDAFWASEEEELYDETVNLALKVFLAGGKRGIAMLPKGVQSLADMDRFNQAAIDYLKIYRLNTVSNITQTTRARATKAIENWIDSGESLDVLTAKMGLIVGETRGEVIAVTEVTRTFAAGNQSAWQSTGVVGENKWYTAKDERVCPICGRLHNQVAPLGGYFMLDPLTLPPELARAGYEYIYVGPPAHPRCRCWLVPVVSIDLVRSKVRGILEENSGIWYAKENGIYRQMFTEDFILSWKG